MVLRNSCQVSVSEPAPQPEGSMLLSSRTNFSPPGEPLCEHNPSSHVAQMTAPLASTLPSPFSPPLPSSSHFSRCPSAVQSSGAALSGPQELMVQALSETPPAWHRICTLAQFIRGREDVLHDLRACEPICAPNLYFSYHCPNALHLAVLFNKPAIVGMLLARGADVNARTVCARTPLFAAIDAWPEGADTSKVVEVLVKFGASVQSADELQNTPLTVAVLSNNLNAAKRLLELGADLNATSRPGWTALHEAAWQGSEPLVRWLTTHGALVDAVTGDGSTARDLALEGCFWPIATYLSDFCERNGGVASSRL